MLCLVKFLETAEVQEMLLDVIVYVCKKAFNFPTKMFSSVSFNFILHWKVFIGWVTCNMFYLSMQE